MGLLWRWFREWEWLSSAYVTSLPQLKENTMKCIIRLRWVMPCQVGIYLHYEYSNNSSHTHTGSHTYRKDILLKFRDLVGRYALQYCLQKGHLGSIGISYTLHPPSNT
jgi:hypothetical protein